MYDYLFDLLSGVIVNSSLAISGYRAIKRSSSFTRGFCAATLAYLTNSRISAASSGLLKCDRFITGNLVHNMAESRNTTILSANDFPAGLNCLRFTSTKFFVTI